MATLTAPASESTVNPWEAPRYTYADAWRLLPSVRPGRSTLRYWARGGSYTDGWFEPLIELADPDQGRLSFFNLMELYALSVLRTVLRVDMQKIRRALEYTREEFGIDRLLLSKQLRGAPGKILIQRAKNLEDVGHPGQIAIAEVLDKYLQRISYFDKFAHFDKLAQLYYPITRPEVDESPRLIVVNPERSFGYPIVARRGISTAVIAQRFNVGESLLEIRRDYDLSTEEIEEAIRYEARQAA